MSNGMVAAWSLLIPCRPVHLVMRAIDICRASQLHHRHPGISCRTKDSAQPPNAPLPDHFLVLPVAPCTGVESYVNTSGCGGEGIW